MRADIEETLARELREVAEGLHVPPMPRFPEDSSRTRHRRPLLAAAAVVAVIAGAAGVVATLPGGQDMEAPRHSPVRSAAPSPSSGRTGPAAPIPTSAPTLAHVVDGRLYVDDTEVPGTWWSVVPAGEAWIALRDDYTWWWGRGPQPNELPGGRDVTPRISPDGRYVAVVRAETGAGILTILDTGSGRDVSGTPTDIGPVPRDAGALVVAVTDRPTVVVRSGSSYLTWSKTVVSANSSEQMVFGSTPAGVVAGKVDGDARYLAEISETGRLTRVGDLPDHDDVTVSPDGTWLAWTPIGTTGGEVTSVPSLEVGTLDGEQSDTLTPPDGWQFKVRTWTWEDGTHLVSTVTDDRGTERMARCSPLPARCLLTRTD